MKADLPGYWMYETSGALRPAVEAYLHGGSMTEQQIAAMRAYLQQWIYAPVWRGAEIVDLRRRAATELTTREAIALWLDDAFALEIDPL